MATPQNVLWDNRVVVSDCSLSPGANFFLIRFVYFLEDTERENAKDAGGMLRYTWETGILLRKIEKEMVTHYSFHRFLAP